MKEKQKREQNVKKIFALKRIILKQKYHRKFGIIMADKSKIKQNKAKAREKALGIKNASINNSKGKLWVLTKYLFLILH